MRRKPIRGERSRGESEMPVKHDLLQDLNITPEKLAQLRGKDARLDQLLKDYAALDAQIVEAEKASAHGTPDDPLRQKKEKRLLIKDEIAKRLV